jgi:hypothetical protein
MHGAPRLRTRDGIALRPGVVRRFVAVLSPARYAVYLEAFGDGSPQLIDGGALGEIAHDASSHCAVLDAELIDDFESTVARLATSGWIVALDCAPTCAGLNAFLVAVASGPIYGVSFRVDGEPVRLTPEEYDHAVVPLFVDVVRQLAPRLRALPCRVAIGLVRLMRGSGTSDQPDGFAAACGMHRRRLERYLARAGLASPAILAAAGRLIRAYGELADPSTSGTAIARRHGFGGLPSLQRQVLAASGLGLAELRAVPRTVIAQRISTRLCRTPQPSRRPECPPAISLRT